MLKAAHALVIFSEILWQKFQRDLAIHARIRSQIHFTHPARAEWLNNLVMADGFSGHHTRHRTSYDRRVHLDGWLFYETAGLLIRRDQRLDFRAQIMIAGAGLIEIGRPLISRKVEGRLKDFINLL